MSKKITFTKLARVEVPQKHQENGVIAFQLVEFVIVFFGAVTRSVLDTAITKDGRQYVIGGDGFIKHGYEIA